MSVPAAVDQRPELDRALAVTAAVGVAAATLAGGSLR
jgi:hypothetical protein